MYAAKHDRNDGTNTALRAAITDLLDSWGVPAVNTHDQTVDTARRILEQRGHAVTLVTLRYRELVIEAAPVAARFVAADQDMIMAALDSEMPDAIDRLCVLSVQGRARRRVA